ncbi:MAG: radical SAM protein [Lachnospiraceae bacterium]|nr:radical SAM protein [Lachnospiraceae bacterium]
MNSKPYSCRLCPRNCGADREETVGYCGETHTIRVGRAALHMWEEPCISGKNGSGAVFFCGCSMRCIFCQNKKISREGVGKPITSERLSEIFFELEEKGANNINLVTGDIYIPGIVRAIELSKKQGLKLPFIFNTSSYVNVESLKRLEGLIDIYLPDLKYIREQDAVRYSGAPGYPDAAKAAIDEMVRQQPQCEIYSERTEGDPAEIEAGAGRSLLSKGVIVRHLLMPGMLIQAKLIVRYLHDRYGDDIYISLLGQYTPNGELKDHPEIDRPVTEREYHSLVDFARYLGVEKAYVQTGEAVGESFIPEFDLKGV